MVDDGRTTDGRTPDHGHPISSPCEPDGSGELKRQIEHTLWVFIKIMNLNNLFINPQYNQKCDYVSEIGNIL